MPSSPQESTKINRPSKRRWQDILFNRRMLICLFQGFSSGLPLYVLVTLVPAWLRTEGIDLATIGLLSLVTLPYTLKFVWAPLLDRYRPPFLGRRRGWTLITQILLLVSIGFTGSFQPAVSIQNIAVLMFAISLFSATQDVVLDAYRREMLSDDELGVGNSFFINSYRLSGFISGSLALILSDTIPWKFGRCLLDCRSLHGGWNHYDVYSRRNSQRCHCTAIVAGSRDRTIRRIFFQGRLAFGINDTWLYCLL